MVHLRRAVIRLSRRRRTSTIAFHGEIDVVADKQIQITIAVKIHPGGAGRPMRIIHAGFTRHIGERSVAVVVIQHVAAEIRHV